MQIARIGDGAAEQYPAELVGGKAANLARVAALGLPVPPAFVLPISLCAASGGDVAAAQSLSAALTEGIEFLEHATGKKFADRPLPGGWTHVHRGGAPGTVTPEIGIACSRGCLSKARQILLTRRTR